MIWGSTERLWDIVVVEGWGYIIRILFVNFWIGDSLDGGRVNRFRDLILKFYIVCFLVYFLCFKIEVWIYSCYKNNYNIRNYNYEDIVFYEIFLYIIFLWWMKLYTLLKGNVFLLD